MDFISDRVHLHRRGLPRPLTSGNEDFGSVGEVYAKFDELKRELIEQQKQLSHLDIVEWHGSTGRLHPAKGCFKISLNNFFLFISFS